MNDPAPLALGPEAQRKCLREIVWTGEREIGLAGTVDAPRRLITDVRVVMRGRRDACFPVDLHRGEIFLHVHPGTQRAQDLEPSLEDLAAAVRLAEAGIGFGLLTCDAGGLYVVTEPPTPRLKPGRSCRTFELGRFAVTFWWRWRGAEAEG